MKAQINWPAFALIGLMISTGFAVRDAMAVNLGQALGRIGNQSQVTGALTVRDRASLQLRAKSGELKEVGSDPQAVFRLAVRNNIGTQISVLETGGAEFEFNLPRDAFEKKRTLVVSAEILHQPAQLRCEVDRRIVKAAAGEPVTRIVDADCTVEGDCLHYDYSEVEDKGSDGSVSKVMRSSRVFGHALNCQGSRPEVRSIQRYEQVYKLALLPAEARADAQPLAKFQGAIQIEHTEFQSYPPGSACRIKAEFLNSAN